MWPAAADPAPGHVAARSRAVSTARVAGACLLVAACSDAPRQVTRDLVRELAVAEVIQETPIIDAGAAGARRWLAAGWYPDEGGGAGPDFVWSEGDVSGIDLVMLEPATAELTLRCRPFSRPSAPQRSVDVRLNGRALAEIELDDGFASYPLTIPKDRLRSGRNLLQLAYRGAVSPRELGLGDDWRRLALALDWLRVAPGEAPPVPRRSPGGDALEIPVGTSIGYHVTFRDLLRLELDAVVAKGGDGCRLRCRVVRDREPPATVAELEPGATVRPVVLTGPPGEPFRLELQAIGPAPREGYGGVLELLRPRLTAPPAAPPRAAAAEPDGSAAMGRPNIVIYLVDALRVDRLGVYGQVLPLSPRLDGFASTATVYEQAWAQSSWTRPAVASLLTGLSPEVHRVHDRMDRLSREMATLPASLAGSGYQTAAVVANPNVSAPFGLDRGFEEFVLMPPERRRSSDVHAEVVRWLARHDPARPFLLYVHTVDPHLPYDPPARFRDRFAPSVVRADLGSTEVVGTLLARDLVGEERWAPDLLALYNAEVAANDESFGALLDELERRGLGDDTVIVFVSDHGEEFYDHRGWIHGRTLYREVLQVPLVIRYPAQHEGRREAAPVSHVDLMPTLLELAGLTGGPELRGRSLLGHLDSSRSVAAHLDLDGWGGFSTVAQGRHAIRHSRLGYTGPAELYDLEADVGEQRDLGGELGVSAGAMLEQSRREVLDDVGRYDSEAAVIEDELRRRLEALGYF